MSWGESGGGWKEGFSIKFLPRKSLSSFAKRCASEKNHIIPSCVQLLGFHVNSNKEKEKQVQDLIAQFSQLRIVRMVLPSFAFVAPRLFSSKLLRTLWLEIERASFTDEQCRTLSTVIHPQHLPNLTFLVFWFFRMTTTDEQGAALVSGLAPIAPQLCKLSLVLSCATSVQERTGAALSHLLRNYGHNLRFVELQLWDTDIPLQPMQELVNTVLALRAEKKLKAISIDFSGTPAFEAGGEELTQRLKGVPMGERGWPHSY
eukprot:TRINITY_DN67003_c5_g1_i1.p1 TRINITY_DN67003_c5_g1~~TRINITY_DN67003_c5_g1_i1.p1  ORF type:complete len:260 (+),score=7.95 TRINITY_DN67003_c5_g1_i1:105-884(+)